MTSLVTLANCAESSSNLIPISMPAVRTYQPSEADLILSNIRTTEELTTIRRSNGRG